MAATNKQQVQEAKPCPECGTGTLQTSSHGSCGICFECGFSPCS